MTLRSALLPLALVFGTMACDKDDTGDTDIDPGSDSDSDSSDVDPNSITGIATNDGRFDILVDIATRAGLDGVLAGEGTYTVFAPTDDAFEAYFLEAGITAEDIPQNSLVPFLTYHALPVELGSTELGAMQNTMAGGITLFIDGSGPVIVNQATITEADIQASNGVIHVIDDVLFPPTHLQAAGYLGLTSFAAATGEASADVQAIINNLNPAAPPVTLFAPNNAAFADVSGVTAGFTEADYDAVLSYHVTSGAVASTAIPGIAPSLLMNDSEQNVSLLFDTSAGVMVNDATVTVADINTLNGTLHVIDTVLLPPTVVDLAVFGGFSSLVTALEDAGLAATLAGDASAYTVFAPNDAAFTAAEARLDGLNTAQRTTTLLHHVVAGDDGILSSELTTSSVTTLSAQDVDIVVETDGSVTVDSANVVTADIVGTNGVVHEIDAVLAPTLLMIEDRD